MLGLILPQIGSIWQPYNSLILGFLMFMVALNFNATTLMKSIQSFRVILFALIMLFVVSPLLALSGQFLFSPTQYIAIILALSAPAAISSAFWCTIFRGHIPVALVVSVISNLLSIITIPLTMSILAGIAIQVDFGVIFLNLLYITIIPIMLAQAIKRLLPNASKQVTQRSGPIQHIAFFLLLWGAVSPGAILVSTQPIDFLIYNVFLISIFSICFIIAYLVGKRFGRTHAITLGVVSTHKNAVLAIVIGGLLLGSEGLPPLIANIVAQNIFLIPAMIAIGCE